MIPGIYQVALELGVIGSPPRRTKQSRFEPLATKADCRVASPLLAMTTGDSWRSPFCGSSPLGSYLHTYKRHRFPAPQGRQKIAQGDAEQALGQPRPSATSPRTGATETSPDKLIRQPLTHKIKWHSPLGWCVLPGRHLTSKGSTVYAVAGGCRLKVVARQTERLRRNP